MEHGDVPNNLYIKEDGSSGWIIGMDMKREREKTKKNGTDQMAYLVGGLEHFFISGSVGNNHPNWFSYFSEGLKPPTRYYNTILC